MRLSFEFEQPHSHDQVRTLFEAMASVLMGWQVSLQRVDRSSTEDLNGEGRCFVAKWTDRDVTFDEKLINGDGNPRDRWGYLLSLTLTLPSLTLHAGGDHDPFRSILVEFEGTGRQWLALRKTVRGQLGELNDRSHQPWIASELLPALVTEGDLPSALELARESFARSEREAIGREQILEWLATHDPDSVDPAVWIQEAPGALDGWLALERAGGSNLTEAFARLCPFELQRWTAAGLPPAPWFTHPAWPFEKAPSGSGEWKRMHGRADQLARSFIHTLSSALGFDSRSVTGESREGVDGWQWYAERRARVSPGTTLPIFHVTLDGVRRTPSGWKLVSESARPVPSDETLTWSWMGGPATGDAVLIVERALPTPDGRWMEASAIAFTVVGTSEFRARAEALVREASGSRWLPVDAADSLEPWAP